MKADQAQKLKATVNEARADFRANRNTAALDKVLSALEAIVADVPDPAPAPAPVPPAA